MGYIFLNGVLLTPACALIIFASGPLYNTFYDPVVWARALAYCVPGGSADILSQYSGPSAFATMDPRHDQQLGGVIMKLAQEFIYGTILFYVFNQWFRKESREDDPEPAGEEWLDNQLNRA